MITFPEINLEEIMARMEELKQAPHIIALQRLYDETPAFKRREEIKRLPEIIEGEDEKCYRFPGAK